MFPDTAPGSFTEVPGLGWAWTTFHDYQWDLNYANPGVFRHMLAIMLTLANRGVDVLRLDAAPFLWKRLGTDSQNQPEAHLLLQAFRALTRLAAPGLVLKAEAIVGPEMLVQYLGAHDRYQPECDLAYDNQLMVMLWSTLATRDVRLAEHALSRRRPAPAPTAWVSYLRCHDDIGWAVSDADAAAVGLGGFEHRRFLNEFFAGRFPGSFARGAGFQENPATGDARISGMAASLCGIESAVAAGDEAELTLALRRLESLYAVVFSFGGIPLIYMGDELAMTNDPGWADDLAHAHDNRWMHRPRMDWTRAARRADPASLEGRAFAALRGLAQARQELLALRSGGSTEILPAGNQSVLAYRRSHPRSAPFLSLTNFSDVSHSVDAGIIARAGLRGPRLAHASTGTSRIGPGQIGPRPDRARTVELRLAYRDLTGPRRARRPGRRGERLRRGVPDGDGLGLHADRHRLDVDRLDGAGRRELLVDAHLERLGGQVDEHRVQVVVVAGDDRPGLVGLDQRHRRLLELAADQRHGR